MLCVASSREAGCGAHGESNVCVCVSIGQNTVKGQHEARGMVVGVGGEEQGKAASRPRGQRREMRSIAHRVVAERNFGDDREVVAQALRGDELFL